MQQRSGQTGNILSATCSQYHVLILRPIRFFRPISSARTIHIPP